MFQRVSAGTVYVLYRALLSAINAYAWQRDGADVRSEKGDGADAKDSLENLSLVD